AIQTQIWIAMIAYLLVSFARHLGKTGWTVQRLLRIIQVNLFEIRTLQALISSDKIPIIQQEAQISFLL
ncbi:MAG: IS4 family transposase, partial [Gammaproteobacteria bacterium]|nr:IS4 family transposase [Gammaproteobacteria bacterium]